jgi:DNA replication ATP-dependent helicase Dna2
MARNELAAWMSKRRMLQDAIKPEPERSEQAIEEMTLLPATIDNARECKMCYAVDSCMLYRKVSAVARSHLERRLMIDC